jgi:hypothetical protein
MGFCGRPILPNIEENHRLRLGRSLLAKYSVNASSTVMPKTQKFLKGENPALNCTLG